MAEIRLRAARPDDAADLAELSRRSFDTDLEVGAPGPGGPPGYDEAAFQIRMMNAGDYFVILADGRAAGGAIVFDRGDGVCELGRIFIEPGLLRTGIGTRAMELVADRYPHARRWILDTPEWNTRTRGFYEGLGFTEYGRVSLDTGFDLILYEKRLDQLF